VVDQRSYVRRAKKKKKERPRFLVVPPLGGKRRGRVVNTTKRVMADQMGKEGKKKTSIGAGKKKKRGKDTPLAQKGGASRRA